MREKWGEKQKMLKSCLTSYCTLEKRLSSNDVEIKNPALLAPSYHVFKVTGTIYMEIQNKQTHNLCIDEFSSLRPQKTSENLSRNFSENSGKQANLASLDIFPACVISSPPPWTHQIFIVGKHKQKDFIGGGNFLMHSFGLCLLIKRRMNFFFCEVEGELSYTYLDC